MKLVPLNFALMKSPINWMTVILMVFIAAFAADEILRLFGATPSDCGCNNRSLFPVKDVENN